MSLLTDRVIEILNIETCPALQDVNMGDLLNDLDAYRNPSGVVDFKVDSNLSVTAGTGLTWDTAFKTLTEAFAANNTLLALNRANGGAPYWAGRNRVAYKGDANSETLTTLGEKMDVIGVGSGGGSRPYPQIVGTHVISAVEYSSCRFINMGFVPLANGNDIFTISGGQHGLAFLGCHFDAGSAIAAGSALVLTACSGVRIIGNEFTGPYTDATIEILSGNVEGLHIIGNYIEGNNQGIELKTGVASFPQEILIKDNEIRVATICINDVDTNYAAIINNGCTTLTNDGGAAGDNIIIGNKQVSRGNWVSSSDATNVTWPVPVVLAG